LDDLIMGQTFPAVKGSDIAPPVEQAHPPKGEKTAWHEWWRRYNTAWAAYWSATGQDPAAGIFGGEEVALPSLADLPAPEQEEYLASCAPASRALIRRALQLPRPLSPAARASVLRDIAACPDEWRAALMHLLGEEMVEIAAAAAKEARRAR
jgi:hypothetical protein